MRLARDAGHMTHAQIGAAAGTSRSTVMRVLRNARIGSAPQRSVAARTRTAFESVEGTSNWKVHLQAAAESDRLLRRYAVTSGCLEMAKIADLPNAHPAALRCMAGHDDFWVRRIAAANANCPPAAIARAAFDNIADVRAAAASNPNCPAGLLIPLGTDSEWRVRAAVAANANCPPGTVAALIGDEYRDVQQAAVSNPNCPPGLLRWHATQPATAAAAAANPACPSTLMRQLADGGWGGDVLRGLAANPACGSELLARLADSGGIVTQRVATNPNTPTAVLERIAGDPQSSQRAAGYARYNLRTRRGPPHPPAAVLGRRA